jgi:Cof subfamily protein (haloacid dehalogenase superfamily)
MAMDYRLIAADLDGTLRPEQEPFRPRVRRARECGVRVVIATGRMFRTAEPLANDLGILDGIICDHGGTVRDLKTRQILWERRMPVELARQVIEWSPPDLTLIACLDEEFYTIRVTADAARFVGIYAAEHLHAVSALAGILGRGPQKLVFVNAVDVTQRLFHELTARYGAQLQVVQSFPRYVELTHRDVSKGKAVEWLAARWGIPRQQVIAIGDQDNDRSMIEWAGLGVAMGNAVESVKKIADYVAPAANEDGAADVIERFVLSNARNE